MKTLSMILAGFLVMAALGGCGSAGGNIGNLPTYKIPDEEAVWIRSGSPLVFEDDPWYPQDAVDVMLDSEVYLVGEFQGVQVFSDKADVRPYNRLYTKFGKNQFRIFKKVNDSNKSAR